MTDQLILIGGGGHARSCIEVIQSSNQFQVKGIIDSKYKKGELVSGYEVIGDNDAWRTFVKPGNRFLITVGQLKSPDARVRIYNELKEAQAAFARVTASTAFVSRSAVIGEGTIVMHYCMVNAEARIGNNVILNSRCLIEHDCSIGHHTHVSTGALINGHCTVGERVFIGSGVVLLNGVSVASDVIIGAGAVVHRPITEAGTYVGNPARKLS